MSEKHIISVRFYGTDSRVTGNQQPKLDPRKYHYVYSRAIPKGTHVIVPAGEGFRAWGPFSIGVVTDPDEDMVNIALWGSIATKPIIDIIDDSVIRLEARKAELFQELKRRSSKIDEMQKFAMLAQMDSGSADLLREFQELSGFTPALPSAVEAPEPVTRQPAGSKTTRTSRK